MSNAFLKNTWYMVGWADELDAGPVARVIADEDLVVFRTGSGQLTCLQDTCPHRFAPLARGRIEADGMRCMYHGLVFGTDGRCIENPMGGPIPAAAKVRSFPVVAQDRILWVWMGDESQADPARIPRMPCFDWPDMRFVYGYTYATTNYELITDNLLDLTHAVYLHPGFGGEAYVPEVKFDIQGTTINALHRYDNVPLTDFYRALGANCPDPTDQWDDMRWDAPSVLYLESGATGHGRPRPEGLVLPAVHILSPESASSTHYWWASGVKNDSPISDDDFRDALSNAFDIEDKPMIEAVQRKMKGRSFWDMKPVLLQADGGGVRARRMLKEMIEREQAR